MSVVDSIVSGWRVISWKLWSPGRRSSVIKRRSSSLRLSFFTLRRGMSEGDGENSRSWYPRVQRSSSWNWGDIRKCCRAPSLTRASTVRYLRFLKLHRARERMSLNSFCASAGMRNLAVVTLGQREGQLLRNDPSAMSCSDPQTSKTTSPGPRSGWMEVIPVGFVFGSLLHLSAFKLGRRLSSKIALPSKRQ